ncbi:BMC domain-containing protein [Desulfotalea psychrophila]|uniref:Related to carbon dioxide concentrating mechanism protein (PduA related) n=1 Tax=Desulfotalea psychrophila (strain LSv54 / DSM 12343) TaxID=177439 RepID=Q6AM75_DESPS|nr:BMC domain-containing protein [Desulfotalea psychrophila]CAG36550.1 related to carbon dioxide concentrating mechanism protein (PduA related) [Desulfotalea psychrophila LSv54]
MGYHVDGALGLIETLGMVPAISGADAMLKTADVTLVSYENIGSTLVAVMVKGDTAAVQASVDAGAKAAAKVGQVTAQNVMPRPVREVDAIAAVHGIDRSEAVSGSRPKSMGFVETFGIVFALEAIDAMVKAANVEVIGYENVASGYISVLVEGDVAACQAGVAAGVQAVERMGGEVHSSLVIPTPHPDIELITRTYALDKLLP